MFACALVAVLGLGDSIGRPDAVATARAPDAGYGTGTWAVAHWIRLHPTAHSALYDAALVFAIAFGAGAFTRLAATLLWTSLFLLVSASLVTSGNHAWGAPLLALLGLLLTPLGDAWSVDAWRRRRRGDVRSPSAPDAAFGFAMWWIGLVLGAALLSAAYTKLSVSGLEWITSGAVRFHFVEDAGNAVVPWGLWVAGHQSVAIAISAAAILVEGTFILNVLRRNDGYRAAFGLIGLSLHLGFLLFQGVLWWAWIILYLAFLPWQTISQWLQTGRTATPTPPTRRLSIVHALAITGLLAHQGYASFHQWEFEPLLSHYPMYAGTSRSWEAFFESRRWYKFQRYTFVLTGPAGERLNLAEPVPLVTSADRDRLIDTMYALYTGIPADERSTRTLVDLRNRIATHVGRDVDAIDVFVDVDRVDFDAMRIDTSIVDMHAFTLRLSPPELRFVEPAFGAISVF